MKHYRCLGIMIGSSLDGIDLLDCQIDLGARNSFSINKYMEVPLHDNIKKSILAYSALDPQSLMYLSQELAKYIANQILHHFDHVQSNIDIIGLHGVTLFHIPEMGLTYQLGCGQTLAHLLGVPVVSDFRFRDILAGGEGTPMAPIVERYLFPEHACFLNLGGIANLSFHRDEEVIAYDVCPFNQVFNHFANKLGDSFDAGGKHAERGSVHGDLLFWLSTISFFALSPPKSLDNNWIKDVFIPDIEAFNISVVSVLATLIDFFSTEIASQIKQQTFEGSMLITGGGAYNDYFIECLLKKLQAINCECVIPDDIVVDAKEALLMALSAVLKKEEKPNFISSVTGASMDVVGGIMYDP